MKPKILFPNPPVNPVRRLKSGTATATTAIAQVMPILSILLHLDPGCHLSSCSKATLTGNKNRTEVNNKSTQSSSLTLTVNRPGRMLSMTLGCMHCIELVSASQSPVCPIILPLAGISHGQQSPNRDHANNAKQTFSNVTRIRDPSNTSRNCWAFASFIP